MERFLLWGMEPSSKTIIDMNNCLVEKLREFMENEARSCSMDFGCVTPLYAYRMMGGMYPLSEIESTLDIVKEQI